MHSNQAPLIRTIVYVDSFNLYYGALKRSTNKWLDLERLFGLVLTRNEIIAIKYFTAKMESPPPTSHHEPPISNSI